METEKAFGGMKRGEEEEGIPPIPPAAAEKATEMKSESEKEEEEQKESSLSPREFKIYNRMAEHMDMFHERFRQTWNLLHTATKNNTRPRNLSMANFLALILQFCHHLTIHHTIEEQHIFPVLAQKMDFFKGDSRAVTDHEVIHHGVEALEKWVGEVKSGERDFVLRELGEVMDGFGEVLWRHLDEEVEMLMAESMRRYWSAEEMMRMPM